jgi:hypothetical protein
MRQILVLSSDDLLRLRQGEPLELAIEPAQARPRRMRALACGVALLAAALGVTGGPPAPADAATGNQWLELAEESQVMYLAGAVDAWITAYHQLVLQDGRLLQQISRKETIIPPKDSFSTESRTLDVAACITGMTPIQVAAIARKFMQENPHHRHLVATTLAERAVLVTCRPAKYSQFELINR